MQKATPSKTLNRSSPFFWRCPFNEKALYFYAFKVNEFLYIKNVFVKIVLKIGKVPRKIGKISSKDNQVYGRDQGGCFGGFGKSVNLSCLVRVYPKVTLEKERYAGNGVIYGEIGFDGGSSFVPPIPQSNGILNHSRSQLLPYA